MMKPDTVFRSLFATGAVFGFLAVAAGAFGAHGLKGWFQSAPHLLPLYQTAVQYQMFHALALLLAGLAAKHSPRMARRAGFCFIAGIILFSGSLYALALDEPKLIGMITPFGGVAFLIGWVFLGLIARTASNDDQR